MRVAAVALLSLALGACGSMTQEDYYRVSASMDQLNGQLQQNVNQGWVTLQQGQQAPAVGDYRYQNSAGTWIYCQRVSSSVVNCREL